MDNRQYFFNNNPNLQPLNPGLPQSPYQQPMAPQVAPLGPMAQPAVYHNKVSILKQAWWLRVGGSTLILHSVVCLAIFFLIELEDSFDFDWLIALYHVFKLVVGVKCVITSRRKTLLTIRHLRKFLFLLILASVLLGTFFLFSSDDEEYEEQDNFFWSVYILLGVFLSISLVLFAGVCTRKLGRDLLQKKRIQHSFQHPQMGLSSYRQQPVLPTPSVAYNPYVVPQRPVQPVQFAQTPRYIQMQPAQRR